jgi:hypothetical protein
MALAETLRALALLTPFDVPGERKVRVGHQARDGGYVFLDRLRPSQIVYSFGIGRNVSFDLDFATRGHTVFMYDHTIDGLPETHERFMFSREGIAAESAPAENLWSLVDHLARRGHAQDDMILKLDVEGHEWPLIDQTPQDTLMQFEQIVLEAHRIDKITRGDAGRCKQRALAKLNETHTLFHVHANNARPLQFLDGLPVPALVELSYVRSDLVQRAPSATIYPTEHDRPNVNGHPDVPLLFFPFMPMQARDPSALASQLQDCAKMIDDQSNRLARLARRRQRELAEVADAAQ